MVSNIGKIGKIIVTKDLQKIIDQLHYKVGATEWSGVLFYYYTGEFNKDMVLTIRDIMPKDLGDAASTSYDVDANIPSFMLKNGLTRHAT